MVTDTDIYIAHTELAAMMAYRPRCHLCKCRNDPCAKCAADPAHITASPACECDAVSAEAVDTTTLDNKLPANCDVTIVVNASCSDLMSKCPSAPVSPSGVTVMSTTPADRSIDVN
eukprot:COSAG02_NODE_2249_length_9371_cov_6.018550_2_plen_116_part_00